MKKILRLASTRKAFIPQFCLSKYFVIFLATYCISLLPLAVAAQQSTPAPAGQHDGQHDFDFDLGTWKTHIRRLQHPLTGSTIWVEAKGTVAIRKVWDGRAQLEEIEADSPTGHWESLTLFLYNAEAHQWNINFTNSSSATFGTPCVGEFKNGIGEFYSQDTINGRVILVRVTWSDIKPDTHKFEQAFSDNGGKTWETNFVANLERIK